MSEHVHLKVQPASAAVPRWRRWFVVALMALAVGALASAFFLPWWHFTLYAPQYPHGLRMEISLTGVSGDVGEIDELNHYIGMAKLESVATIERHIAPMAVALLVGIVLILALSMGRKTGWLIAVPAVVFPLTFLGDTYFWLQLTGHALDKRAPIHLPAFTPQMFGNGAIGQFLTFAAPSTGFWLACAGVILAVAATYARARSVCAHCTQRGTCSTWCKSGFIGEEKG